MRGSGSVRWPALPGGLEKYGWSLGTQNGGRWWEFIGFLEFFFRVSCFFLRVSWDFLGFLGICLEIYGNIWNLGTKTI